MNTSAIGFFANIESVTLSNKNYRHVIFTGKNMQLVLMTLQLDEEIGLETHEDHDQFFRVEAGQAKIVMGTEEHVLNVDDVAIVPAGVEHNIINIGSIPLQLYTIYAPPEHPHGLVQSAKV